MDYAHIDTSDMDEEELREVISAIAESNKNATTLLKAQVVFLIDLASELKPLPFGKRRKQLLGGSLWARMVAEQLAYAIGMDNDDLELTRIELSTAARDKYGI